MLINRSRFVMAARIRFGGGLVAVALAAGLTPANLGAQTPPRQPADTGVRNTLPSRPMGMVHEAHAGMQDMSGMTGMAGTHGSPTMASPSDTMPSSATQLLMDLMTDRVIRQRIMADTMLSRLTEETIARMTPAQRDHIRLMMAEPAPPAAAEMHGGEHSGHATAKPTKAAPKVLKTTKSATPAARKRSAGRATPTKAPTKPAPKTMPAMPGMPAMDHSKMPGMGKP